MISQSQDQNSNYEFLAFSNDEYSAQLSLAGSGVESLKANCSVKNLIYSNHLGLLVMIDGKNLKVWDYKELCSNIESLKAKSDLLEPPTESFKTIILDFEKNLKFLRLQDIDDTLIASDGYSVKLYSLEELQSSKEEFNPEQSFEFKKFEQYGEIVDAQTQGGDSVHILTSKGHLIQLESRSETHVRDSVAAFDVMTNEEGESMLILTRDCKVTLDNLAEESQNQISIRNQQFQDGVQLKAAYIKQVNAKQFVVLGVKEQAGGDQIRLCFAFSNPTDLTEGNYAQQKTSLKTDVLLSSDFMSDSKNETYDFTSMVFANNNIFVGVSDRS